jgi:serine-type D-Ala-D-Ala carboxypeptidase/endopeptidase (penicillin-binding protein 4)
MRRRSPGVRLVALAAVAALTLHGCAADDADADTGVETVDDAGGANDGSDDDVEVAGTAEGNGRPAAPAPPTPTAVPSPSPTTADPPPPPASRRDVVEHARTLVAAAVAELDDAELAVLVTDDHGREIAAFDPDQPMLPASTLKVVTAAAVLTTLGPDERLATSVATTGPITGDGVLLGDLVLTGSGDPTLVTDEYARWIYPARPRTRLAELADAVVDAGVTHVTGDVLGTSVGFTGEQVADGWLDTYFSDLDARNVAGLTVDGGLVTSIRWPTLDAEAGVTVTDVDAEEAPEPVRIPLVGTSQEIEERLAGLDPPLARVELAADPTAHAAAELARLLEERGVEVAGDSGRLDDDTDPTTVGRLATVESPPMEDLLRFAVQRSDNHLTDHLFHLIGRVRTGEGSWERGERALLQVLERFGVDTTGARFADGSGLSREDRVTARLLVDIDLAITASRFGPTWDSLMAVTGESGTLQRRLAGTPASGRFIGKTGTLRDVTALSGSVVGADDGRYHLAVLANDAQGPDRTVVRALMDELILALVADLEGCALEPVEGVETGPLGRPPSVVAC